MSHLKSLVIGLAFACASTLAVAHSDHGDVVPVTQQQAAAASTTVLKSLVKTKEIDEKWLNEKPQKTSLKNLNSAKVWESVYVNEKETDTAKRNLYIYFDEMGSFLGAGHEPMKN